MLAKNSGIVMICPIPIKRSRVFTKHAIMREKVENRIAPKDNKSITPIIFMGFQIIETESSAERMYMIIINGMHRIAAEIALPRTSAVLGVGVARNLWVSPKSRSQMIAIP